MARKLTAFLFDIAAWISPAHHREWIDGLRAEAQVAEAPGAWACGAVSTALKVRLADSVKSGQAIRIPAAGYVMATLVGGFISLRINNPDPLRWAVQNPNIAPTAFLEMTGVVIMMLGGALSLLFSSERRWLNRLGRAVFGLGALFFALDAIAWPVQSPQLHNHNQEIRFLAAFLFSIAALSQILRRPWLFGLSIVAAFGVMAAGWGLEAADHTVVLLLLAGIGLLIGPKPTAAPKTSI